MYTVFFILPFFIISLLFMSLEGLNLRAYHTMQNFVVTILEITIISGLPPKWGCHNHVDGIANQKILTYQMHLILFISVS